MHQSLKQGGYLFTLFGPIWSSDVGHHLSIPTPNGDLHFFDGILAPWEHLTSTREAIYAKLAASHGEEAALRAVTYIYDYSDLNRLFEQDYLGIVKSSGFTPVLILRNKNGHPPNISGATGTRELLLILKKGPVTNLEKASCLVKFTWAFAAQQIRTRLSRLS